MLSFPLGSVTGCSAACFYPKPPSFVHHVGKNRFWLFASLSLLVIGYLILYLPLSYLCSEGEWKFFPSSGPCWSEANPSYTTLGLITGVVIGISFGTSAVFFLSYLKAKAYAQEKVVAARRPHDAENKPHHSVEESAQKSLSPSMASSARTCSVDGPSTASESGSSRSRKSRRRPLLAVKKVVDQDVESATSSLSQSHQHNSAEESSSSSENNSEPHNEYEQGQEQELQDREDDSFASSKPSIAASSKASHKSKSKGSSSASKKSKASSKKKKKTKENYATIQPNEIPDTSIHRDAPKDDSYLPSSYKLIKAPTMPTSDEGKQNQKQKQKKKEHYNARTKEIHNQHYFADALHQSSLNVPSTRLNTWQEDEEDVEMANHQEYDMDHHEYGMEHVEHDHYGMEQHHYGMEHNTNYQMEHEYTPAVVRSKETSSYHRNSALPKNIPVAVHRREEDSTGLTTITGLTTAFSRSYCPDNDTYGRSIQENSTLSRSYCPDNSTATFQRRINDLDNDSLYNC
eukprot:CAMPEP_0178915454 /NCGR_PEP_ID=MMETSP0786-20121207/12036_1 /TAXON_ID=186022 /ORGANISM="Thalassionema frauenfeldii, Strain CCMP 1798" /LENGTH=515 /DNA_ID=CAMNT_0020588567 /DNA_START=116 /DNA_END=1663 /DNA_ORIENTATION=-